MACYTDASNLEGVCHAVSMSSHPFEVIVIRELILRAAGSQHNGIMRHCGIVSVRGVAVFKLDDALSHHTPSAS